MRLVSWFLVLCTVLAGVAVMFPAMRLDVGGHLLGKRSEISLYKISTDREMVRSMLAVYHRSKQRKLADTLFHKVAAHLGGHLHRAKDSIDDVVDAMDTLDDLSDADIKTAAIAYTAAFWSLLVLIAMQVLSVFPIAIRGVAGRARRVFAVLVALLIAALAVGFHLGCREAVWEVNDEFSRTVMSLAPAAYVLPAAAIVALLAAIALAARRAA